MRQQRHVHIPQERHISAKQMHASWNQDGVRHDRGSFDSDVGSLRVEREIARAALKLSVDSVPERAVIQPGLRLESQTKPLLAGTVYLVADQAGVRA